MILESLRVLIVRIITIIGAPFVFWLVWLTGSVNWRREFRDQFAHMWKAERARDWKAEAEDDAR